MRFWFKKYYPIWRAGSTLCIGQPGSQSYLELKYEPDTIARVEKLLAFGVSSEDIRTDTFYHELKEKDLLDLTDHDSSRAQFFFKYLGVPLEKLIAALGKKILIFGVGAAGSVLAYMLAQIGFKNIVIVDNDVVNYSDTEKSFVFKKGDIGKSKAPVIADLIKAEFSTKCTAINQSPCLFSEIDGIILRERPDFVVKACDPALSFRYNLNQVCFQRGIPFIFMAYSFENLSIGPLYDPGSTCCDKSINDRLVESKGNDHDFRLHERLFDNLITHPSISFNVNLLASFVLKEIVFFFVEKKYCNSYGRYVSFNPLTMSGGSMKITCHNEECTFKPVNHERI